MDPTPSLGMPPEQSHPFFPGPQEHTFPSCYPARGLARLEGPDSTLSCQPGVSLPLFIPSLRKNPAERMSYLELMVSVGGSSAGWGEFASHTWRWRAPLACPTLMSKALSLLHSCTPQLSPPSPMPGPMEGLTGSAVTHGAGGGMWPFYLKASVKASQGGDIYLKG